MSASKNPFKIGDKVVCIAKGAYPEFNLPFDTVFTVTSVKTRVIGLLGSQLSHIYERFTLTSEVDKEVLSPVCRKIKHMEQRFKEKQHAAT